MRLQKSRPGGGTRIAEIWTVNPTTSSTTQRGRILIVDDESNARSALAELLKDEGYSVETAADGFKALGKFDDFAPALVVSDLRMPGMDGLELLRAVRSRDPECQVIVMTAHGAVETAVAAMREGAADYLAKPLNFDELLVVVERAFERRNLRAEAGLLRERLSEGKRLRNIVGSSPEMMRLFDTVRRVASSRASVLITGESGTGKELIAAAIVEHSQRADKPFVKLHCAALAETLLESELFGHERGAFTGAVSRRDGRFQQADGGTLFLDEIGELTPATQVKLLRFLQEHEFQRVGGNETVKVDVRVVAASNRDLPTLVKEGKFREDLFYRLNVVAIEAPPLRKRLSDVPLLAMYFLRRASEENGRDVARFSDDALDRLMKHDWPGNVRELQNAVERAVVVCRGDEVQASDLPSTVAPGAAPRDERPQIPGASMSELEKFAILKTLEHVGGSTSRAAAMLGISARTIQYRLKDYAAAARRAEATKASLKA
jgi:DNA-binding NtrC family response regulator